MASNAAFGYYGGKQRIASKIVPLLPPHTVYVETHAGGCAVLCAKGQQRTGNNHDCREVVNDDDERIVNFYRVLQDPLQSAQLQERLAWTLYSRAEHQKAAELLRSGTEDAVLQAWAWFVQIEQSFSNKLFGGWTMGVFGRNHPQTWQRKVNRLAALQKRFAAVYVECLDPCAIIQKWDSPQTCFYVDPPYVGASQGHYAGYTQADFEALLSCLDATQGSFVLSCYANPALEQYPHWEHFTFAAHASSSSKGTTGPNRDKTRAATTTELGDRTRTEHVYRVDRSHAMRKECQEATHRLRQRTFWD